MKEILDRAAEVFGNEEVAKDWMESEIQSLGWRRPIELLSTEAGRKLVLNILGRIEHGVY